jgi:hypothetical protein
MGRGFGVAVERACRERDSELGERGLLQGPVTTR